MFPQHLTVRALELHLRLQQVSIQHFLGIQTLQPLHSDVMYLSVSQPPGRGPVPGPGINYTGPREVLLEFVILVS